MSNKEYKYREDVRDRDQTPCSLRIEKMRYILQIMSLQTKQTCLAYFCAHCFFFIIVKCLSNRTPHQSYSQFLTYIAKHQTVFVIACAPILFRGP